MSRLFGDKGKKEESRFRSPPLSSSKEQLEAKLRFRLGPALDADADAGERQAVKRERKRKRTRKTRSLAWRSPGSGWTLPSMLTPKPAKKEETKKKPAGSKGRVRAKNSLAHLATPGFRFDPALDADTERRRRGTHNSGFRLGAALTPPLVLSSSFLGSGVQVALSSFFGDDDEIGTTPQQEQKEKRKKKPYLFLFLCLALLLSPRRSLHRSHPPPLHRSLHAVC